MENKKYIIYENDLKFREHRNLNINKIDWSQNDIKHLFNTNYDSFEYRLYEFKKNKEEYLDLELMKITDIIFLCNDKYLNLRYLFLSNNNLSGIIDLSKMKNLEILDCNHNKIEKLIKKRIIRNFKR
jgi:Leucine-rich repeat (LRR) protein